MIKVLLTNHTLKGFNQLLNYTSWLRSRTNQFLKGANLTLNGLNWSLTATNRLPNGIKQLLNGTSKMPNGVIYLSIKSDNAYLKYLYPLLTKQFRILSIKQFHTL